LHFGPDTGPAALIFLSMSEWLRGNPQSALRTAQIAIDDAHRLENALMLGQVLTLAAQLHYMAQDYESMLRLAKEGDDNCEQNGIRYFGAICQLYQIWGQAWSSHLPDCVDKFRRGLAAYEDMKCGLQVALFRGMLGQLLLAANDPRGAAKECELALSNITIRRALVGSGDLPYAWGRAVSFAKRRTCGSGKLLSSRRCGGTANWRVDARASCLRKAGQNHGSTT
jgi:hypothetical protein